jgi:hypothetical protein
VKSMGIVRARASGSSMRMDCAAILCDDVSSTAAAAADREMKLRRFKCPSC